MNLPTFLRRFRRFERRWIPLRPERDAHEATVRTRLTDDPSERPADDEPQAESAESAEEAATEPPGA